MGDIVESLFGPTPFQVQQQQIAGLNQSADRYAQQDPFQRAAGGMFRAGGMLAGPAVESMGMVNPAVQQAQIREQVMGQGGDISTSAGLKAKAAQFQAAGDSRTALQLMTLARKQEAEESKMALEKAHAAYYGMGGASGRASPSQLAAKQAIARNDAMKFALQSGMSGQELLDFVEGQVQRVTDTWNQTVGSQPATSQPAPTEDALSPITSVASNLNLTPEGKAAMIADAQARGDTQAIAALQSLPVSKPQALPQSKAEVAGAVKLAETQAANNPDALAGGASAKKTGEQGAEMNVKQYEAAITANQNLTQIKNLRQQLESSDAITGMGADVLKGIARAKALLGGEDAAKKASDTEILDVMLGSEVFPLIKSLGIGARGMDTPAEREFMRQVLTGTISLNKATLLKMADLREKVAERDINAWNERIDRGELDEFYKQTGRTKAKIGQPKVTNEMSALPPAAQLAGKTVRDTVTGNRYKSDGSKWVKQ